MRKWCLFFVLSFIFTGITSALTVNWNAVLRAQNNTYGGWMGVAIVAGNVTEKVAFKDILSISGSTSTIATWTGANQCIGFAQIANVEEGTRYGVVQSGDAGGYGPLWANDGTSSPRTYQGSFELSKPEDGFALVLFNAYNQAYGIYNYQFSDSMLDEDSVLLDLGTLQWRGQTVHVPVTLPEPSVMALLALGLAGVVLRRRAS